MPRTVWEANRQAVAALATLRDSASPVIGIDTSASHSRISAPDRPFASLPKTHAWDCYKRERPETP